MPICKFSPVLLGHFRGESPSNDSPRFFLSATCLRFTLTLVLSTYSSSSEYSGNSGYYMPLGSGHLLFVGDTVGAEDPSMDQLRGHGGGSEIKPLGEKKSYGSGSRVILVFCLQCSFTKPRSYNIGSHCFFAQVTLRKRYSDQLVKLDGLMMS